MSAPGKGQLSAAKTGWLVLILFFGWLAFLLVPDPKPKPEPLPAFVVKPPSRLVALGLPDNPDLEHLPEFFALYADKAEWKNDKAIFAYWNPGSNSYSYFFEAIREKEGVRYRAISKLEACKNIEIDEVGEPASFDDVWSESAIAAMQFTSESATHPVMLIRSMELPYISTLRLGRNMDPYICRLPPAPKREKIQLLPMPKWELQIPKNNDEQTKK